jgi:hypothetical protein
MAEEAEKSNGKVFAGPTGVSPSTAAVAQSFTLLYRGFAVRKF